MFSLSPSKVDCFLGCKKLFKFRYIDKILGKPNKYFLIGNVVHKSLELFHKTARCDTNLWNSLMKESYKSAFNCYNLNKLLKEDAIITTKDILSVRDILRFYLKNIKKNHEIPNIIFLEKLFKININKIQVFGKADRVDKMDDEKIVVVDYKTSFKPKSFEEIESSVQLGTYGYWIRKEVPGNFKIFGRYIYLKNINTNNNHNDEYLFEITDAIMSNALEKYIKVDEELKSNCNFIKNTQYRYCYSCEYSELCSKQK